MEQALLLNASYEPLKVINWQKAITLWCQGKVEVIAVHDREIRAVSFSFKMPSVIRLLRFVRIKRRFDYVPFSRANVYARDEHTCQYCNEDFSTQELTFDHVMPVASPAAFGVTGARAGVRRAKRGCGSCAIRVGPTRRRPSASLSGSGTHLRAGVTTSTGTPNSTRPSLVAALYETSPFLHRASSNGRGRTRRAQRIIFGSARSTRCDCWRCVSARDDSVHDASGRDDSLGARGWSAAGARGRCRR